MKFGGGRTSLGSVPTNSAAVAVSIGVLWSCDVEFTVSVMALSAVGFVFSGVPEQAMNNNENMRPISPS